MPRENGRDWLKVGVPEIVVLLNAASANTRLVITVLPSDAYVFPVTNPDHVEVPVMFRMEVVGIEGL